MTTANHHFSAPVEIQRDEPFTQNRRINGLDINLRSGGHVITVGEHVTSPWTAAAELGAAAAFGGAPGALGVAVNSAAARTVLRPSLQGAGRDRFR